METIATRTNDTRVVMNFVRTNIFYRFGIPRAIISDQGTHFYNKLLENMLKKYGVTHCVATPYHPQTNGQTEISNREIKKILEKVVKPSRKDWAIRLDDELWAHRIAYKAPIGMSPFMVVFGKACHLLVEIEHRAYWVVKACNMNLEEVRKERKLQLQELEEIRLATYEKSKFYKEKTKTFHDQKVVARKDFRVGQKMLLYKSKLGHMSGKLHSTWEGPFIVIEVFPYGVVEIKEESSERTFKVNGHHLRIFNENQDMLNKMMDGMNLTSPAYLPP